MLRRRRLGLSLVVSAALFALFACAGDVGAAGDAGPRDAASPLDAEATTDAEATIDAEAPRDAEATIDAEAPRDATLTPDVGATVDAEAARDAVAQVDAETTLDAGAPTPDAGPSAPRRIVAVGYGGRRIVSDDLGLTWTDMIEDVPMGGDDVYLLRCLTYAAGVWVAQGWRTYTSSDGVTWTQRMHGDNWRGGIAYGNGTFVSVGGVGRASVSSDGLTWRDVGTIAGGHLRDLAFGAPSGGGAGLFVAIGDGARRISSSDGVTWRGQTTGGANLQAIAAGNGVFVAVGDGGRVTRTVDGVTWDEQTSGTNDTLESVVFDGARFVASGGGGAFASTDGLTWSQVPANNVPGSLTYIDGVWLGTRWADGIYRSTNLTQWTRTYRYSANHLRAFAAGP